MPKRSWDVLVAEGKEAVQQEGDAKWRLGDLAEEVEPTGPVGVNTGSHARLSEYAAALGLELSKLLYCRKVAAAWPDKERSLSVSWIVHAELVSHPDRFSLIRRGPTWTQAKALMVEWYDTHPEQRRGRPPNREPNRRLRQQIEEAVAEDPQAAEVVKEVARSFQRQSRETRRESQPVRQEVTLDPLMMVRASLEVSIDKFHNLPTQLVELDEQGQTTAERLLWLLRHRVDECLEILRGEVSAEGIEEMVDRWSTERGEDEDD